MTAAQAFVLGFLLGGVVGVAWYALIHAVSRGRAGFTLWPPMGMGAEVIPSDPGAEYEQPPLMSLRHVPGTGGSGSPPPGLPVDRLED